MSSWLVLGLGNPLSGTDAFGPAVVAHLRAGSPLRGVDVVDIVDGGTDLLGSIGRFADYDRVVLVDAVTGGNRSPAVPRHVAIVAEQTFAGWDARSPGAHEMSPVAAVRLFRALQRNTGGNGAPDIHLVGLFVAETDFARPADSAEIAAGADAVRQLARG